MRCVMSSCALQTQHLTITFSPTPLAGESPFASSFCAFSRPASPKPTCCIVAFHQASIRFTTLRLGKYSPAAYPNAQPTRQIAPMARQRKTAGNIRPKRDDPECRPLLQLEPGKTGAWGIPSSHMSPVSSSYRYIAILQGLGEFVCGVAVVHAKGRLADGCHRHFAAKVREE